MKRLLQNCPAGLFLLALMIARNSSAQNATFVETAPHGVVLTKLFPPTYPPLARLARIEGDVKIELAIRRDGGVESAEAISGHPMLKQAAVDSAHKSTFECGGCVDATNSYSMTYTFGFLDDGARKEVIEEQTVRSSKCLYMWKCSVRRSSTWPGQVYTPHPREVTVSGNHVTIRVHTVCFETSFSAASR